MLFCLHLELLRTLCRISADFACFLLPNTLFKKYDVPSVQSFHFILYILWVNSAHPQNDDEYFKTCVITFHSFLRKSNSHAIVLVVFIFNNSRGVKLAHEISPDESCVFPSPRILKVLNSKISDDRMTR